MKIKKEKKKISWSLYFPLKNGKPTQFSHQPLATLHFTARAHFAVALRAPAGLALPWQSPRGSPTLPTAQGSTSAPRGHHPCPSDTAARTMPASGPVPWVGPLAPCCGLVSSPGPGPSPISFSSRLNLLDVAWLWLTPSPCQGLLTDPDTPGCGCQHPLVRAQQVQSPQAGASPLCHVASSSVMAGRAPASTQGTSALTCAVINRGK